MFVVLTAGGGDIGEASNTDIYGQTDAIIAAWGIERVDEMEEGTYSGGFTLPASDGKSAQVYTLSNRQFTPEIANYA